MTPSPPADLRFGLLLTPAWLAAPVQDELRGREFTGLSTAEASSVWEGVALLPWIRGGVVGAAVVLFAYLTRDVLAFTGPVLLVYFGLLLWLPLYILILGVCRMVLRRSAQPQGPVVNHTGVLRAVRWAPLLALVIALVAGVLGT